MKKSSSILPLLLLASFVPAHAGTKDAYDTFKGDTKTGSTVVTLDSGKGGFKVHTTMGEGPEGQEKRRNLEYKTNADGSFVSANLRSVSDQVTTFYAPGKAPGQITLSIMSGNTVTGGYSVTLQKQDYLFTVAGDPSVWQVLLDVSKATPSTDGIYRIFIAPERSGVGTVIPVRLRFNEDVTGKLDNKPVKLTHYVFKTEKSSIELYADEQGKLMLADIRAFGIRFVHQGFQLDKQ